MNMEAKISGPSSIQVPADFAEHSHLGNRALKAHYKVGDKTLAKWRRAADIPANSGRQGVKVKDLPPPNDFKDLATRHVNRVLAERFGVSENTISRWRKMTGTASSIVGYRTAPLPKQGVPPPPPGVASEACQFLRSTHRPVYHRIVEGKEFKGQYVVGINVLNETELVEFARSRGFKTSVETLAAFDKYD